MKSPLMSLENVWKIYQIGEDVKIPAIKGISLNIFENEFVPIMGPSGSGKSTLLHLLGCLDMPTKGNITLKGKDISRLSEDALAKIRGETIGFVFQAFNLLPEFTAVENVMLPMVFQGTPEDARRKKAINLLGSVGLKERINHKPNQMSGGEKQRVAIARALANDPEIILADEPTGNLDSGTGKQILELLMELHKKYKKTIIVVTHDPAIADYSKNKKFYFLKDGVFVKNHIQSTKVLRRE